MSGHPSLGFRPSSRHQSAESTRHEPPKARTVPSSTFLTSSTAYSSTDLRGFVSPHSHVQGFHSSGVSPREKPYELVARRCPRVVARAPCPRLPGSSRSTRPPSGPCSSHRVRRKTQLFRPRPARSPPELRLPRVFLHTPSGDLHRPSDHGLSRPSSCCQRAT
jgi:hypothetical protein